MGGFLAFALWISKCKCGCKCKESGFALYDNKLYEEIKGGECSQHLSRGGGGDNDDFKQFLILKLGLDAPNLSSGFKLE